jgi:hypothetical protein
MSAFTRMPGPIKTSPRDCPVRRREGRTQADAAARGKRGRRVAFGLRPERQPEPGRGHHPGERGERGRRPVRRRGRRRLPPAAGLAPGRRGRPSRRAGSLLRPATRSSRTATATAAPAATWGRSSCSSPRPAGRRRAPTSPPIVCRRWSAASARSRRCSRSATLARRCRRGCRPATAPPRAPLGSGSDEADGPLARATSGVPKRRPVKPLRPALRHAKPQHTGH